MTKEKEILILTEDMTDKLPEKVQESVVWLSEQLRPKELVPFNPIVKRLLEIKELSTIKYDPEKEAETVKEYKAAKKAISSFNASVRAAKKEMKGAYDQIGKKILVIERGFIEEASEVLADLQITFKPYLDAEKKKALDKEEERQRIANAEVLKLKQENAAQMNAIAKQNLKNKIKYDILAVEKTKAISQLNKLNVVVVKQMKEAYASATFEQTVEMNSSVKDDYHLLDESEISEFVLEFEVVMKEIEEAYSAREKELEESENLRIDSAREKGHLEAAMVPPPPPSPEANINKNPFFITDSDRNFKNDNTGVVTPNDSIKLLSDKVYSLHLEAIDCQNKIKSQSPELGKLAGQISDMMKEAHNYIISKY